MPSEPSFLTSLFTCMLIQLNYVILIIFYSTTCLLAADNQPLKLEPLWQWHHKSPPWIELGSRHSSVLIKVVIPKVLKLCCYLTMISSNQLNWKYELWSSWIGTWLLCRRFITYIYTSLLITYDLPIGFRCNAWSKNQFWLISTPMGQIYYCFNFTKTVNTKLVKI